MLISPDLYEYLNKQNLALWYTGYFDDSITEDLIELSEYNTGKQQLGGSRKKVAFLMAESFQNIIRHGSEEAQVAGTFGISSGRGVFHIFSSNPVPNEVANQIHSKLKHLNQLTPKELKAKYRQILANGKLSAKGGAGLGLIEMAKKSGRPIQYRFNPIGDQQMFSMQIDHKIIGATETNDPNTGVEEHINLSTELHKENLILLFKGDFNQKSIGPVLKMLSANTSASRRSSKEVKRMYHIGVELLDNISRHSMPDAGKIDGCFILSRVDGKFQYSTINKVDPEKVDGLRSHLDKINSRSVDELNKWYRTELKRCVMEENHDIGIGLIDVGRITSDPLEYEFQHEAGKCYFNITVTI